MITVTLDTNVLIDGTEAGSDPEKQQAYHALREWHDRGVFIIGLTTRFAVDKIGDRDPARVERQRQEAARYSVVPGPGRYGISRYGQDLYVDQAVMNTLAGLFGAAYSATGRNNTLWDADHLYGHRIAERDYFLTYDKPVLRKAPQLLALGIRVHDPRPFVQAIQLIEATLPASDQLERLLPAALDLALRESVE